MILALALPLGARADSSLPWTPSAVARHHLALLVDDAGLDLPLSQWPLPRAAVATALGRLPGSLPETLDAARAQVAAELRGQARTQGSVMLRGNGEPLAGFGDEATPGSSLSLRSPAFGGGSASAQLGVRIERSSGGANAGFDVRLEGSAVATEVLGIQWQAWSHRSWWGPGWQSSLVLGNNAQALTGAGLQRAAASTSDSPWLAWLGPWNFELFVARLDGVAEPAHPHLVGSRLTVRPSAHLEIGLTRSFQWGGRGRPQTLRSFIDALAGRGLNAGDQTQQTDDPGNEMAGFDVRLRCPTGWKCAGYLQLMGEDEAGRLPSKYLGLYGLEAWSADGRQRWFAELAETGCRMPIGRPAVKGCAYRNHAYPGGYVSGQRWLGASVGPDSRLLTLGWMNVALGTSLRLHYGHVGSRIGAFSALGDEGQTSGRLVGFALRQSLQWGRVSIAPELGWVSLRGPGGGRSEARAGVQLQMSFGYPG